MKEFNWEGFKNGEFAVRCNAERRAKEFVKEVHLKGIKWGGSDANETYWDVYRENTCYYGVDVLSYGHVDNCDIKIIEWRSDDMKNFREVIRDIKEGEVWENENFAISIDYDGDIAIDKRNGIINNAGGIWVGSGREFKLKQQSVTFEEVLNSDKRCRVEHSYVRKNDFTSFGLMLNMLACSFTEETIKEIIKNGKWYLEP